MQYPHCDPRILHPPGECEYCDNSGLQEIRRAWDMNFTTKNQDKKKSLCPAIKYRGLENCESWPRNRPKSYLGKK